MYDVCQYREKTSTDRKEAQTRRSTCRSHVPHNWRTAAQNSVSAISEILGGTEDSTGCPLPRRCPMYGSRQIHRRPSRRHQRSGHIKMSLFLMYSGQPPRSTPPHNTRQNPRPCSPSKRQTAHCEVTPADTNCRTRRADRGAARFRRASSRCLAARLRSPPRPRLPQPRSSSGGTSAAPCRR